MSSKKRPFIFPRDDQGRKEFLHITTSYDWRQDHEAKRFNHFDAVVVLYNEAIYGTLLDVREMARHGVFGKKPVILTTKRASEVKLSPREKIATVLTENDWRHVYKERDDLFPAAVRRIRDSRRFSITTSDSDTEVSCMHACLQRCFGWIQIGNTSSCM